MRSDDSEPGHFHAQQQRRAAENIHGRLNFSRSLSNLKLLHSYGLIRLESFIEPAYLPLLQLPKVV